MPASLKSGFVRGGWLIKNGKGLWMKSFYLFWRHAAESLQSCPTLCDPVDGSPPGSPVPGILQARTLEWGAIFFSNAWKWKVKVKLLSRVRPSATPWTAAHQAPPSMGFSRQEYWSDAIAFSVWRHNLGFIQLSGQGGLLFSEDLFLDRNLKNLHFKEVWLILFGQIKVTKLKGC